jgi:hypothetical protein
MDAPGEPGPPKTECVAGALGATGLCVSMSPVRARSLALFFADRLSIRAAPRRAEGRTSPLSADAGQADSALPSRRMLSGCRADQALKSGLQTMTNQANPTLH